MKIGTKCEIESLVKKGFVPSRAYGDYTKTKKKAVRFNTRFGWLTRREIAERLNISTNQLEHLRKTRGYFEICEMERLRG